MPQPTLSQVHIDRAVREAAIAYQNEMFIASSVAPVINVEKESDFYFIFDKANWFRDTADQARRPGTRAPRSGYTLSNARYELEEHAIAHPVPDRVVENADEPLSPLEDGAEFAMHVVLIKRERVAATVLMGATAWGTNTTLAGTDQWSDFVNSDPANDVQTAINTVLTNTGRRPNVMLIGHAGYAKLKLHPDGLDRFKHTQTGIMTDVQIAQWLDLNRIIVGTATYNTANEGVAFVGSQIWGDNAVIMYVPDAPAPRRPAAAYTFQKKDIRTRTFREEAEEQIVIEVSVQTDTIIVGTDYGYQFRDLVA